MRACLVSPKPPALVLAAACGEAELVDVLLRGNARLDDADRIGWTACHAAADGIHHDVLALLLARQPNLTIVNASKQTALCCTSRASPRDGGRCALMLLEAGASVELMRRFSLFQFAAVSTAAIQALINRGVVVREIVGRNGATPLHGAARFARDVDVTARNGHADVVDRLLRDERVDPAASENNAILNAARGGYIDVVERLLRDGRCDIAHARRGFVDSLASSPRSCGGSRVARGSPRFASLCRKWRCLRGSRWPLSTLRLGAKWDIVCAVKHFRERRAQPLSFTECSVFHKSAVATSLIAGTTNDCHHFFFLVAMRWSS
jgi:hypothetical protein